MSRRHSPLGAGIRLLPWTGAPMVIAPLAGALSERFGNRPFMVLGLALQAIGLGWVALIRRARHGLLRARRSPNRRRSWDFYVLSHRGQRGHELGSAGRGRRRVGNDQHALASVLSRQGVYHSPHTLIDGFKEALWVGVGFSALGVVAALLMPRRRRADEATATTQRRSC